jgi:SAM-dependent methyltransferase
MERLTWTEMQEYWERHVELRAPVQLNEDPDGLGNVCHPGQPLWLNRYYARFQRRVYLDLLSLASRRTGRALDVGCGAGRWSRLLADQGYETVGIDLQPDLIAANRRRHRDIEFHTASAQSFVSMEPFDLVSTVTVIQHVPFEQQTAVVERLRGLTADGGHVIALENVSDQAPHVFSRSIGGWRTLFERAGFKALAMRRYDYSPCLRSLKLLMRGLPSAATSARPDTAETLNAPRPRHPVAARRIGRSARLAVMRACTVVDGAIEPICIRLGLAAPSVHCGFLFRVG